MARFELTVDDVRLVEKLKRESRLPTNVDCLRGFNLFQTIDEKGIPGQSVVLGPLKGGRRGRKPLAIPVTTNSDKLPSFKGDRLSHADVEEVDDHYELVRHGSKNTALRIFRTGLLMNQGGTAEDMARIAASGRKLRYHGAFPITADAGFVVGEGIDLEVTAESRIVTDDRFGRINGLVGVPKMRETMIEGVIGGPVLLGQVDGTLCIRELTKSGAWRTYDVTGIASWQKKFMDLAATDAEYLKAVAEAEKHGKRDRQFRIITPPSDHPDA